MSVVVRMEMPKSCRECPFMTGCSYCEGYSDSCVLAPDGVECGWDFFHEEGPTKRPDWCPIICSIPEGHGRLVDMRDIDSMMENASSTSDESGLYSLVYRDDLDFDGLPTIVPAERREE